MYRNVVKFFFYWRCSKLPPLDTHHRVQCRTTEVQWHFVLRISFCGQSHLHSMEDMSFKKWCTVTWLNSDSLELHYADSSRGLLRCDPLRCCGRISTFLRTMLPPAWWKKEDFALNLCHRGNFKSSCHRDDFRGELQNSATTSSSLRRVPVYSFLYGRL